jgi:hypothetical protein
MNKPQTVDFFRLPKDTRERFVGCCTGQAPPAPLLRTVPKLGNTIFWRVVLCAAVTGGVAWLGYNGFGEIGDSWMVQGLFPLLLYVGLLFLGALGILGAARAVLLRRQLPFRPGKYLFPFDLVDAQTKDLRLLPLAALENTRMVEHQNEGTYTHTAFEFHYEGGEHHTFTVGNAVAAEMAAQAINASREAIRAAVDAQDLQRLAVLDVFIEPRLTEKWQEEPQAAAAAPKLPIYLAQWRWAALAAAVVVAIPLWHLRNIRSDDLGFRNAIAWAADGGPGYEEYLRLGRRHLDKVRTTFLPRAAIRKAQQAGALRDLDALAEKHRGTPLEAEAREAQRQILTDRAAAAAREGDIRALREFLAAHPGSHVDAHVRASIAGLYERAKERYRARASAEPGVLPFMEKLFDQLAATGAPEVTVRFERKATGVADPGWQELEERLVDDLNRLFASRLARDAELFIAFRREAGAPESTARPVMSVAYDATRAGAGYKLAHTVALSLPGAAAKAGLQRASTARAAGVAFNDLGQRLAGFFFDLKREDLAGLFGESNPLRYIGAPPRPVAPVRVPTVPRIPWENLPGWPPR